MKKNHPEAIVVQLGGRKRTIKLGPAAFRFAELKHGRKFTVREMAEDVDFGVMATFCWVGLLPDGPDVTELQVLEWLTADGVDEYEIYKSLKLALERMKGAGGDETKDAEDEAAESAGE
jgi:hypothetical protein